LLAQAVEQIRRLPDRGDAVDKIKSSDGTTIAFDRLGQGPPVILVGGAFSWRRWKGFVELADLLSERFTVLNYDRRGRGDSGDTEPYAVEREFEDLQAMISAAGGSASVWGLSSGGILALEAARAGVAIEKIAAYEPPFIVNASDGLPPDDFMAHIGALVEQGRRSEAVKYFMARVMGIPSVIPSLMGLWPPIWSKLKATAHTLPYEAALIDRYVRGRPIDDVYWSSVATPTLIVSGEKSPEKLRKGAAAIAAALPHAEHYAMAGVSHNVKMSALAPVLVDFFTPAARHSPPRAA
jgi:pimeloyl-ACP methyl ester carboxylesterase